MAEAKPGGDTKPPKQPSNRGYIIVMMLKPDESKPNHSPYLVHDEPVVATSREAAILKLRQEKPPTREALAYIPIPESSWDPLEVGQKITETIQPYSGNPGQGKIEDKETS